LSSSQQHRQNGEKKAVKDVGLVESIKVLNKILFSRKNRFVCPVIGLSLKVQQAKHIFIIIKLKYLNGKNQKVGHRMNLIEQVHHQFLRLIELKKVNFYSLHILKIYFFVSIKI
jgi:hypothetical protein